MSDRRDFLKTTAGVAAGALSTGALAAGALVGGTLATDHATAEQPTTHPATGGSRFEISLAQWSFHRALRSGKFKNVEFAEVAMQQFGIGAVEYVNQFFKDKAKDTTYLTDMRKRAEDSGVKSLLIMCDGEGRLGDPSEEKRQKAVENHYRWVEAARFLGCHSIRVNAASGGSYEEQVQRAADGLRRLSQFGAEHKIGVIVENHGGLSSNGAWLAQVMKTVDHPNCGTLPDFGNFRISGKENYDRYKGVKELMPYAKAVSAKSHDFDADGNEVHTDYLRMMQIVMRSDYHGYIGIEYEGGKVSEYQGILLTKNLLERVFRKLV